ncbi:MAG: hypothetical protein ACI90M_004705 [Candidatus Azotimanducaceae bacterium]|jgi:hypothetical protein
MTEERPLAADTNLHAESMQRAVWQSLSPTEKLAAFFDLQDTAIALAEAGIRMRYPQATSKEVFLRRVARTLDTATMERVYGWSPERSA